MTMAKPHAKRCGVLGVRVSEASGLNDLLCAQRSALPQGDESAAKTTQLAPENVGTLAPVLVSAFPFLRPLPPCLSYPSAIIASRTPEEKPPIAFRHQAANPLS